MKKSSTLLQCRDLMEEIKEDELCFIPSKENTSTFEATVRIELPKIKKVASQKVSQVFRKRAEEEATRIPFQGDMLSLLAQEREDISWQAAIHQVPRVVLAWAVRAGTNTLSTPDNLARKEGGQQVSDRQL